MNNKYFSSVCDLIGNTPLLCLKINYHAKEYSIYAKAEFMNPSGSIKDRIAKYIIEQAEIRGELKKDMTIVEATSGNTGIAFAMIAAAKGYHTTIIMPENMSKERMKIIKSLGAKLILVSEQESFLGAKNLAEQMAKLDQKIYLPKQFSNLDNVKCHQICTSKEILEQVAGAVDAFVVGVGTGGTLMGVRDGIKPLYPQCLIVAVEPTESAILSGATDLRPHKIQGIGDGFIPAIVDVTKIDSIEKVSSDEAIAMAQFLIKKHGLMVGISSGANIVAALNTAEKIGSNKTIVTVLPDRVERYFSTDLFAKS